MCVCAAARPWMKELPKIRKEDRCGYCHTCLNPHLKKPCKTRRDEVSAAVSLLMYAILLVIRVNLGELPAFLCKLLRRRFCLGWTLRSWLISKQCCYHIPSLLPGLSACFACLALHAFHGSFAHCAHVVDTSSPRAETLFALLICIPYRLG